jgi:hypothetical protein
VVLLAGVVVLKLGLIVEYAWGTDGRYYLQLAEQVRDGGGLASRVSLYHQGFQSWPHRVNQAPLWPTLLGLTARHAPLEWLARRLPEALFLLDLVLVYLLGNRLWRRVGGGPVAGVARTGAPDFGHVAVLLFGLNPVVFRFTSAPYSEALGFGVLFCALLAVDLAIERRSAGWAASAGALAGLAVLTRAQMLPLPVAVFAALALGGRSGLRAWRLPAAGLVGMGVTFAPWLAYLASWVPELTPTVALGMATAAETPGLATYQFWVPTDSWLEYLADRSTGLAIAFTPGHRWSYFESHGPAVALVPLAVLLGGVEALRRPRALGAWLRPERALVWACLLAGVGMLAPIHHAHSKLLFDWLFAHRHGLPFVLLLLPAAAFLLASSRRAVVLVAAAAVIGGAVIGVDEIRSEARLSPLSDWDRELGLWLDAHAEPPVVVTTEPSGLALLSGAYFHWTACDEPAETTRQLLEEAGADYVVVYPWEPSCAFLADAQRDLVRVREFGGGRIVVLGKRAASPPSLR